MLKKKIHFSCFFACHITLVAGVFIFIYLYSFFLIAQDQNNGKLDSIKATYPHQVRTIIKTNPTAIIVGVMPLITSEYRLLFEFPSAPLQSSQIGFSYLGKSPFIRYVENDTLKKNPNAYFLKMHISGFRLQASYRFFVNKWIQKIGLSAIPVYAPGGFYISPHVSYASAKITYKFANQYNIYFLVTHVNVNLLCGWQFILFENAALDMFTGIGYKQNQWFEHNQNIVRPVPPPEDFEIPGYFSPVKLSVGINFGYCF